jgi:hypothetical protein
VPDLNYPDNLTFLTSSSSSSPNLRDSRSAYPEKFHQFLSSSKLSEITSGRASANDRLAIGENL